MQAKDWLGGDMRGREGSVTRRAVEMGGLRGKVKGGRSERYVEYKIY